MRVWILGGEGQLGSAVANLMEGIPFVSAGKAQADITDLEGLKRAAEGQNFTHVINCAAYTNVDLAEKESELAYLINADGPKNLGMLGKELGMKIIHISTDYVFDGTKDSPYIETDPTNPLGVYGNSKYEGEQGLLELLPESLVVRTSWVFGNKGKNFTSLIFERLQKEEEICAVSHQKSCPTYACDLAEALLDLREYSGIFHFAHQNILSRYEIACDFLNKAKELGIEMRCKKVIPISASETIAPRPTLSALSTSMFERVLGRKPRSWHDVLSEFIGGKCLNAC